MSLTEYKQVMKQFTAYFTGSIEKPVFLEESLFLGLQCVLHTTLSFVELTSRVNQKQSPFEFKKYLSEMLYKDTNTFHKS